jgi:DNA-binding IclR family transcriptional regulator
MNADLQCYTAARTIAVVVQLAAGPRSAPELAELLGIARPTVRRVLALLTHGGYVDRLPGDTNRKRYRLTRRSQRLGHQMATSSVPLVLLSSELQAGAGDGRGDALRNPGISYD